jgi:hypothetical protein
MKEADKKWRQKNKDKLYGYTRKWQNKNKEKMKMHGIKYNLKKKFDMSLSEYDNIYSLQGGVCAICGKTNKNGNRLSVDHDHKTGKIRELLCANCNIVLGYAHDDRNVLFKMIEYLNKHCGE